MVRPVPYAHVVGERAEGRGRDRANGDAAGPRGAVQQGGRTPPRARSVHGDGVQQAGVPIDRGAGAARDVDVAEAQFHWLGLRDRRTHAAAPLCDTRGGVLTAASGQPQLGGGATNQATLLLDLFSGQLSGPGRCQVCHRTPVLLRLRSSLRAITQESTSAPVLACFVSKVSRGWPDRLCSRRLTQASRHNLWPRDLSPD